MNSTPLFPVAGGAGAHRESHNRTLLLTQRSGVHVTIALQNCDIAEKVYFVPTAIRGEKLDLKTLTVVQNLVLCVMGI
jgi:hypothetical protein